MQMLPPTVAAFQILNDARKCVAALTQERRSAPLGCCGGKPEQLCDPARRRDLDPSLGYLPCRPIQLIEIDQGVSGDLRLRKQPSSSSQPGVTIAPLGDFIRRGRSLYLRNRIKVHDGL
jgi:hypothetical protein